MQRTKFIKKTIGAVAALMIIILLTAGVNQTTAFAAAESQYDIIEISSAEALQVLSSVANNGYVNTARYYYILTSDIDFSELQASNGGWQPIGFKTLDNAIAFEGVFDGNGYTIKGLWINAQSSESGSGLFGFNKGTVKNLNIETDEAKGGINAKHNAGAVAGINEGTIENCTVSGKITVRENGGGICGDNKGTISACINYSDIFGASGIGGICGKNAGAIKTCQNAGTVQGTSATSDNAGGIAGYIYTGSIKECANYGGVSGYEWIGGITGYAAVNTKISDCLNAGATAGTTAAGGITGYSNAEIGSCLNTALVSGGTDTGGIAGVSNNSVTNSYYLDRLVSLVQNTGEDETEAGTPVAENEIITRTFLEKINGGGANWFLRSPDGFHYYPELTAFTDSALSKQNAAGSITAYKNTPVLNSYTLTYGEALSTLEFAADAQGTFFWQEPDMILNAGQSVTVFAAFIPSGDAYGELYDIAISITVNKAHSVLSVSLENWKAGQSANTPEVTVSSGEREVSEIIIEYKLKSASGGAYSQNLPSKAGKYTVRVTYNESGNYLAGYAEYDFEITPDLTWLIILSCIIGALALLALAVFWTDKKFRYFARIKKLLVKETVREVVVEKPVVVEKTVYAEPQVNTAALSDYMEQLTPREMQVAKKILEGKTRKEIAEELFISETTVKTHIFNILQKTDCENQRIFVVKFKI